MESYVNSHAQIGSAKFPAVSSGVPFPSLASPSVLRRRERAQIGYARFPWPGEVSVLSWFRLATLLCNGERGRGRDSTLKVAHIGKAIFLICLLIAGTVASSSSLSPSK